MNIEPVLSCYGLSSESTEIKNFGSGLINHTWQLRQGGNAFILQRINETVFKNPPDIAFNIDLVSDHLKQHYPDYFFVSPVAAKDGKNMVFVKDLGYFRLFPFVSGSHAIDVVSNEGQAFEAATQFGRFTNLLKDAAVSSLKITIPQFHDLSLRYTQFLNALKTGNPSRIKESEKLIRTSHANVDIVKEYEKIKQDKGWLLRVTHHDTKISNVLFDEHEKGICVIDLDTIMPGYFISDVGDMMRTYLSPVSEEEKDFSKIEVRDAFYEAIAEGYMSEMSAALTQSEKNHFLYAGKFMIYMQALRFLTDYLNDDIYYGSKYPGHNFVRAENQLVLLQRLMEKERHLVVNGQW